MELGFATIQSGSKKLRGHIGLGLSVLGCVCASSAKVTLTLCQEPLELGS